MICKIFNKTVEILYNLANKLHMTYNEINIIVYYFIIPLTYLLMLDFIIGIFPVLSLIWTSICIFITIYNYNNFSQFCDFMFVKSVNFLLKFNYIGWDYYKASVNICIILMILVYIVLGVLLIVV